MDEVLIRFPDAAKDIFKQVDDKNLAKCREVNKIWCNFVDNGKLLWRRIQKYYKNQTWFQDAWKLVTTKVPTEKLRELAQALKNYTNLIIRRKIDINSSLHIGAAVGNTSIYEFIVQSTGMANLARKSEITPQEKNPATIEGKTSLHLAAAYGHLDIVKHIPNRKFRR